MAAQPSPLTRALLRRRTWSSRQNHRKRHRHRRLRDRIGRCIAFLAAASVAIVLLCATLPAPTTEDFGTTTRRAGAGGTGRNSRNNRGSSRTSADGASAGHAPAGGNANSNSTSTGAGVGDRKNYHRGGTSTEGGRERSRRRRTRATAVFQLRFHTRLLDVLLVSSGQQGGSAAGEAGYYYLGGDAEFPHNYYGNPIHEPDPASDAYYYNYPRGSYHPGYHAGGSGEHDLGRTSGVAHSRNEGCGGSARADSGCTRMVDMDRGFRHDMDLLAEDRGWPRGDHGRFEFAASRGRGSDDVATSARPAAPRAGAVAAAVTAVLAEVYAQAGLWGAVVGGGTSTEVPPPEIPGNGTAACGDDGPLDLGEGEAVPSWTDRLWEVARHWSLARGEAVSWALALWDRWMLGVAAVAAGVDDSRTRRLVAAWWAIDGAVLLLVVGSAAQGAWDRTRRLWRSSRGAKRRQRRRTAKRKKPPRWRASLALGRLAVANLLRRISLWTGAMVAKFAASRKPPTPSRSEEPRPDRRGPVSNEESLEREPPRRSPSDVGRDHSREKAAPLRRLSTASLESDGSVSSFPSRNDAEPFAPDRPSPEVVGEGVAKPPGLPDRLVVEFESSSSFFSTVPGRGRPPPGRGPPRLDPDAERGSNKPPLVSPPKPVRQTWPPPPSRDGGPAAVALDAGSTAATGKKGKKKKKKSASAAASVDDEGHKGPESSPRPTRILQPPASKSDQPRGMESEAKPPTCPVPTEAQREEAFRQLRSFQLRQVERIVASRRAKGEGATTRAPGGFSEGAPRVGSMSPDADRLHGGRLPPPRIGGRDDVGIGAEELLGCDLLLSSILNDIDDDGDDVGGDFKTKGARGVPREEQTLPPLPPPGFTSALQLNAAVPAIGAKVTSSCKLSYQRVVVAGTSSATSSWGLSQPSAARSAAARPDSPPEASTFSGTAEWVPPKTHTENASLHDLLNGSVVGGPTVVEEKPLRGEGVSAVGPPCLTYAKLPFLGSAESFGNGNNANGGDVACHSELSQGSTAATSSWGSSECSGGNVYDGNMW